MTAHRLVTALLDEGEDPKDFLKRLAPHDFPPRTEVSFHIDQQYEGDIDFEEEFDDPENAEWIRQQLDQGNEWAWCRVCVTAQWTAPDGTTFEGHDYLGGCSYHSEEDFKEPGGYYEDMKEQAYEDLVKQVEAATKDI